MVDCIFWDEHTGKCLNGNNLNYGEECDNVDSFPCFTPRKMIFEPCFFDDGTGTCQNSNSKHFNKACSMCSLYMKPIFDQSAKADAGKPRLTLVPRKIIWAIAKVREFGMKKYKDPNNWKRVTAERYRDALFRHLLAYLDDPNGKDPESGLPILWHVATNVAFLVDLEWNDEKH